MKIVSIYILLTLCSCSQVRWDNPIKSPDIYEGDYRSLMKAASDEDLGSMEEIWTKRKLDLNYSDREHGISLLNWCLISKKRQAFEKLLLLGANPNWQDSVYKYPAAIIFAAKDASTNSYLKLALENGGDKDLLSVGIEGPENQTPLMAAVASYSLENVRLLVNIGANVDLTTDSSYTPLTESLIQDQMEIAKYLLDNGADYSDTKYRVYSGEKQTVMDLLRNSNVGKGSTAYRAKKQIIDFLEAKGLKY